MSDKNDEGKERERVTKEEMERVWSPSVAELFVTIRAILARIEGK